jgi:hypothetical protein
MISVFSIVITCLILIPTIPLVLYTIGLFLPTSHIVSRSHVYNTSPEILWAILTSVRDYPAWRSNIREVTIRSDDFESDINKYEDESRVTFVEYSKKDRRTVVMHIEQEHERKLLRVLEERPYIAPSGETVESTSNSTFSGSWSFTLEPVEGQEKQVKLKITEQGVIKKPMVRVSHKLLFGYHRRIDRFIKDLGKEVELGILEQMEEEERQTGNDAIQEEEEEQEEESVVPEEVDDEEEDRYEAGPDDSVLHTTTAAKNNNLLESKILDKEWDMMSELYDKKAN